MHIRPARPEDWTMILPLLEGMEGAAIGADAAAPQRFGQIVQIPEHYYPVALAGAHLVGYGWVQDYGPHLRTGARMARLHNLFVLPAQRRQGIGGSLFRAVTTWAERRGCGTGSGKRVALSFPSMSAWGTGVIRAPSPTIPSLR